MSITRRNIFALLPAALAARTMSASVCTSDPEATKPRIPSTSFFLHKAKVEGDATDHYIPALDGSIHTGLNIKLHETELAPHALADPPHIHAGEELFMVREGTLQVNIGGVLKNFGPGDVAYVASNVVHGTSNVSGEWVRYFALLLGSPKTYPAK